MEIICNSCNKVYSIDESKIPSTGKVYVKCSSCGEKIEVSRKQQTAPAEPVKTAREGEEFKQSRQEEAPVEYFDPETKTALIYCQEIQARLEMEKKLAELGFETRGIKDEADIRHHFRYNLFDLVVLYQHGPDPDDNMKAILGYINSMPAHMRRNTMVLYIHLSGNRYDLYDAFSRGVDATLSPMDITGFTDLVPKLMDQKRLTYKVFFDCLEKVQETVI